MIKFFNTLGHKKENFEPLKDKTVSMYVCGPTVYGPDHLGQARTWLFFDFLKRFLEVQGYKVKLVQNITDIGHLVGDEEEGEDKIEKEAKERGTTPEKIARSYEAEHLKDLENLNILKPDALPRASEYIPQIIKFIQVLIEKGYAYESKGDVYFNVQKFPDYGKLSGRNLEKIVSSVRTKPNPKKKNPADFALWKKAEKGHLQTWDSPWSKGYPGWHIECSVMSSEILGQPFDIHGSAAEHIFPHHENELAQSQAFAGKPLANYWLHPGMLLIDGQKMGKSKQNYITVKDALKESDADTIRLAFLKTLWKKPFDWEKSAISEAKKLKERLVRAKEEATPGKTDFTEKLSEILENNFNTPAAITYLIDNISKMKKDDFIYLGKIFGLRLLGAKLTKKQEEMIKEREKARGKGDFQKADSIRKALEKEGIILEDTTEGTRVLMDSTGSPLSLSEKIESKT